MAETKPATKVEVPADSRLEQLCARWDASKDALAQAKEELEKREADHRELQNALMHEATLLAPTATKIELVSRFLARPLVQTWVSFLKLDEKGLAAEQPAIFDRYKVKPVEYWKVERKR